MVMFKILLVRELFLEMGYIDASRATAQAALQAGQSLFVCTGGEEESLWTTPGTDMVVLNKRKGFVRLALQHGAHLVPVMGIGNTDMFAVRKKAYVLLLLSQRERRLTLTHTAMFLFNRRIPFCNANTIGYKKTFFIALPIFHGRWFTPLPYQVPIKVVMGKPLAIPRMGNQQKPDPVFVDKYNAAYIGALKALHSNHAPAGRPLKIV